MHPAIAYAAIAGIGVAGYTILMRIAAPAIHPVLGAAIVAGIAFVVNSAVALALRAHGTPMPFSAKGVGLLIGVGIAAACVDLFSLLAYSSGLRVTSSFVIGGTGTVLILLVGFLILREPFSWTKLAAIGLILAGTWLLQRESV